MGLPTDSQKNFIRCIVLLLEIEPEKKISTFEAADSFISENVDEYKENLEEFKDTVKDIIYHNDELEYDEYKYLLRCKYSDIDTLEELLRFYEEYIDEHEELKEKKAFLKIRKEAILFTRKLKLDYLQTEEDLELDTANKVEEYLKGLKNKLDIQSLEKQDKKYPPVFRIPQADNRYGNILYHHYKITNSIDYNSLTDRLSFSDIGTDIVNITNPFELINKLSSKHKYKINENYRIANALGNKAQGIEFLLVIGHHYQHKNKKNKVSGQIYMVIPVVIKLEEENEYSINGSMDSLISMNTYLLDPTTSDKIIGTVESYKNFLNDNLIESYKYEEFINYANKLFRATTGSDIYSYMIPSRNEVYDDSPLSFFIVENNNENSANININNLQLDLSYKKEKDYPLLFKSILTNNINRYIVRGNIVSDLNTLNMDETTKDKSRIGFPLDPSQREALLCMCQLEKGEVLAVNGPPGTGKTSMLKAVIATEVGQYINSNKAPVIVACGSTNQSVTNIIGSFDSIALEFDDEVKNLTIYHRWLKGIKSYGWYAPSASRLKEDKEKLKNVNILLPTYSQEERKNYLALLHTAENLIEYLTNDFQGMVNNYIAAFNNSFSLPKREKRVDKAIKYLQKEFDKFKSNGVKEQEIKAELIKIYNHCVTTFADNSYSIEVKNNLVQSVSEKLKNNTILNKYHINGFIKNQFVELIESKIFTDIPSNQTNNFTLSDFIDNFFEVTTKTILFHLSMRIFEGKFLLRINKLEDIKYEISLEDLCMIAPIVVSTFKSAPKLCSYYDSDDQMKKHYLESIDLLIVDEAGQATPEDGSAIFALAKKAIVVGDTFQIEPVWSIVQSNEKTIIEQEKRIDQDDEDFNKGILCSSGSVMQMAQYASSFSIDEEGMPYGLMLTRHYRCVPKIIEFCNKLVYQGKLIPVTQDKDSLFYPFCYAPIETTANRSPSGSWQNNAEALSIAKWLYEKESKIIEFYSDEDEKKTIDKLVAIVTPFSSQSYLIKKKIKEEFRAVGTAKEKIINDIVIGTTHSLQGAEKPIVLFSGVSTPKDGDSKFIDNSTSLLNVAVSRAKDSFIFFGHPKRFFELSKNDSTPSHILSDYVQEFGKKLFPRKIVIVESPEKAKKIQVWLGLDYVVFATEGHFMQLSNVIEEDNFKPEFKPLEKINEIDNIIDLLNDCDELIIATDDDREGEAIGWHFLQRVKSKFARLPFKLKRVRIAEITRTSVFEALANFEDSLNMNIVDAALARTIIDFIIGKKLNTIVQNKYKELGLTNPPTVGRVRNLVLHEVSNYSNSALGMEKKYRIIINNTQDIPYLGMVSNSKNDIYFTEKEVLEIIEYIDSLNPIIPDPTSCKLMSDERVFEIIKNPSTSDIMKIAYELYGYSPRETMNAMQKLYELGSDK